MNEQAILNTIQRLAMSQGFYRRLLRALLVARDSDIEAERDNYREFMDDLEAQEFDNGIALILYLEA